MVDGRVIRGYSILAKGDEPKKLGENLYLIKSQSGNGGYLVLNQNGEWRCECPDYKYRKVECKHIHSVKIWLALKEKLEKTDKINLHQELLETSQCKRCGSPNLIITVALDSYFKGLSLRDIVDQLDQFYGLKVSHVTVLNWIREYSKIISQYAKELKPKLSDVWHTDEQQVKVKGNWK